MWIYIYLVLLVTSTTAFTNTTWIFSGGDFWALPKKVEQNIDGYRLKFEDTTALRSSLPKTFCESFKDKYSAMLYRKKGDELFTKFEFNINCSNGSGILAINTMHSKALSKRYQFNVNEIKISHNRRDISIFTDSFQLKGWLSKKLKLTRLFIRLDDGVVYGSSIVLPIK